MSATLPARGHAAGATPRCEKCLAPLSGGVVSACNNCGWYAAAGSYVEIDRVMEGAVVARDAKSGKMPLWAWLAIAAAVAVIVQSIVVRAVTPDDSELRTTWSGFQFFLGLLGFFACQAVGFVTLMRNDSTAAILDVLLKPLKVSEILFRQLPRRAGVVIMGITGLVAAFAAVVVIGSVPYHLLWSWNVDYRSTQHLEAALARSSPQAPEKIVKEKIERKKIDCLIIGYELSGQGNISTVLLARDQAGKLAFVGGVMPSGEPAQMFELREYLISSPVSKPVVSVPFNSNWVAPKYICTISYASEQDNKKLTDLRWEGGLTKMRSAK